MENRIAPTAEEEPGALFSRAADRLRGRRLLGNGLLVGVLLPVMFGTIAQGESWKLRQLTSDGETQHNLTIPGRSFSPDGQWLCYDRNVGRISDTSVIERAHVVTGAQEIVFDAHSQPGLGPGVAAAAFFPSDPTRIVFIHGPATETGLAYAQWRRFGAIIEPGNETVRHADARDVTPPFTPGALRGGTHVHVPGGPGDQWLGFTYNDMVMQDYGEGLGKNLNLRTIGVTRLGVPVRVDAHPENWDGEGFSVVLVAVTPEPRLQSDEIKRAEGDCWVGTFHEQEPGRRLLKRAFVGTCAEDVRDVFIVTFPETITEPGPEGPLEGTASTFPAPPAATSVKRLTHVGSVAGYVRSNPEGTLLAFAANNKQRDLQAHLVDPDGSRLVRLTHFTTGIAPEVCWHPSGEWIAVIVERRIHKVPINLWDGHHKISSLTAEPLPGTPRNLCFSPDGKRLAFNLEVEGHSQVFVLEDPGAPM